MVDDRSYQEGLENGRKEGKIEASFDGIAGALEEIKVDMKEDREANHKAHGELHTRITSMYPWGIGIVLSAMGIAIMVARALAS